MKKLFPMAVVFALLLPLQSSAAEENAVKMGDIVAYSGEVLVRSKGVWSRLSEVPHPIYSADKVVTRRGRAEMKVPNGGKIMMDIDTNLSFAEKRSAPLVRKVNVLVGDVWFDLKAGKGETFEFKTPSMAAVIKGTSGKFSVSHAGISYYRLTSGSAAFSGSFKSLPATVHVGPPDVTTAYLPPSDPLVDGSGVQTAAAEALRAQAAAEITAARARAEVKSAKGVGELAIMTATEPTKRQAAVASAGAAVARSEAALESAAAQVAAAKEALMEARTLGDAASAASVEKALRGAEEAHSTVRGLVEKAKESAQAAKAAGSASDAQSWSTAAGVAADASFTSSSLARSMAGAAAAAAAGDTRLLASRQETAALLGQLAQTSAIAADNAASAARSGNREALLNSAAVASKAAAQSMGIIEGVAVAAAPTPVVEPPKETPPTIAEEAVPPPVKAPEAVKVEEPAPYPAAAPAPSIETVTPPPDSRDLPTASTSS